MRLILVRHPAPCIAPGICYGSSDIAVDPAALANALTALPMQLPPDLGPDTIMYTSPLRRCAALARALALHLHAAPPLEDARLAEMDFGAWEGKPWDAIPRTEIDAWTNKLIDYAPGGGETVRQVATRIAAFIDDCKLDAIVICHAGTIRLMSALAQQGATVATAALAAASVPSQIDYAAVRILHF